ncbi:MAG: DUF4149 domain-containing protein [Acidobacteriota bacterium]
MKTLIRTLLWLALIVWFGALLFFPITAWASFSTVADTHVAGTIVRKCLVVLHHEGLFAGGLIVVLLAVGYLTRTFRMSTVSIGVVVTLLMLGCTAWSQFGIMPRMEKDRIAAGGAIDSVPKTDPRHVDFDRLHNVSTDVEEAVMLGGLVLVILVARDF